jgi:hypothetical protein
VKRVGKEGSTWDSGDIGDKCHMGQLLIKIQGKFEIFRQKVP